MKNYSQVGLKKFNLDGSRWYEPIGFHNFQLFIDNWMQKCFGQRIASDKRERGDRLLEEVLELLQASGYDKARVATLVEYVYSRPIGDLRQELGGVLVTLSAFSSAHGMSMNHCGQAELERINDPEIIERIRAKQQAKRDIHGPLP